MQKKDEVSQVVKPKDLLKPILEQRSRNYRRRRCSMVSIG